VPVEHLVSVPTNPFNLQGKTVRFTPLAGGSYQVRTVAGSTLTPTNQRLPDPAADGPWYAKGWRVALPFGFAFGGKTWDHVYVNMNGNISFEKPESAYWPQRDPWADAGMTSVAAAIDSRSAAGLEQMIAAFWGPYLNPSVSQVSVDVEPRELAITWNMTRAAWGQAVLGVNRFQARLFASGMIEFTYASIAEHDGIVGLFPGGAVAGKSLSDWDYPGKAPHPSVDIASADVFDAGTVLDFAFTMKNDALTKVDGGPLDYRCWVDRDGAKDVVSVSVSDQPKMTCFLGASPRTGGWRISGRRVDMFVSKVLLTGSASCALAWDVTWWGKPGRFAGSGTTELPLDMSGLAPATVKLSTANEAHGGNIYEVFHYPVVTKSSERLLESIYKQVPPRDDIAIVFTDFRIDDLYGQGGGAIAANDPISGIGQGNEKPRSTKDIGSKQLQMSVATVWLGSPMFDETGTDDNGMRWFNFARGVKWVAHECTHRWGLDLSFANPAAAQTEKLTDGVGHWINGLDTTARYPVSDLFIGGQGIGGSIMGGASWRRNPDGTFSQSDYPLQVPGGYSSLDLYIMGMLPPEKVPPTMVIEGLRDLGQNRFQGTAVNVTIDEITRAMGQRKPASGDAQKTFHMAFYVAHEPSRDASPAILARAQKLSQAVIAFFERATGGVMKIVPSGS
jgi:hypothetical protein